jgi:hypothetical protein
VLDPSRFDAPPDLVALLRVAAERLLADDVLAGLRRGDRRLGVNRVRPTVVTVLTLVTNLRLFPTILLTRCGKVY